jgi:hypothetical protein
MNPIVKLALKQLPVLIPVAKSLLNNMKNPPRTAPEENRMSAMEESLQLLAERSDYLEARLRRMRVLVVVAGLLSVVALVVVFVRS